MANTPEDFLANLSASRLMSEEAARALWDAIPEDQKPQTGEQLGVHFVQSKKLTRYQASRVLHNKLAALVLGEYLVLDKIGSGGMGMVFLARHRKMKRTVAIKVLPPGLSRYPVKLQRFQREMQAAAHLNHPNIVTSHDAGEDNGTHYLVMEYIDGADLGRVVTEKGALSVKKALDYTIQAAKGLQYAHQSGIIHRDIKPQNLLLDKSGVIKILDMGLARFDNPLAEDDPGVLTQTGSIMGTADFMSPEQALNTKYADHRSDIYSLGCTLYYLITGEPLFQGESMMEKLLAHRENDPPSLLHYDTGISPGLDATLAHMLDKKPERRFQSMAEVIEALEQQLLEVTAGCSVQSGINSRWIQPEYEEAFEEESPPWENLKPSEEEAPPRPTADQSSEQFATREYSDEKPTQPIQSPHPSAPYDPFTNPMKDFSPPLSARVSASVERARVGHRSWNVGVAGTALVGILALSIFLGYRLLRGPANAVGDPALPALAEAGTNSDPKLPSRPTQGAAAATSTEMEPAGPHEDPSQIAERQKQFALRSNLPLQYSDSQDAAMILIPPGEFRMGSPAAERAEWLKLTNDPPGRHAIESEGPARLVTIDKPFYVGKFEVTVGQFRRFADETGYRTLAERPAGKAMDYIDHKWTEVPGANWRTAAGPNDNVPVRYIAYEDAKRYCLWLSQKEGRICRLPTSEEWEYITRAGSTAPFAIEDNDHAASSSGESLTKIPQRELIEIAWFAPNSDLSAQEVGQRKANPFGLHDLLGNVAEWCSDSFPTLEHRESISETAAGRHDNRILRGGSYLSPSSELRSAAFRYLHPLIAESYSAVGFRVVVDPTPPPKPLGPLNLDLLSTLKPERDTVAGHFQWTPLGIETGGDYYSRLVVPLDFIPPEYELDLAVRRLTGNGPFYVGLTTGGRQFAVILDDWSGSVSGIDQIDGQNASRNESTRRTRLFTDGKISNIKITVRTGSIRVVCDGRTIINWSGDLSRLSLPPSLSVNNSDRLFVGSHKSSYEIDQMVLTPLGTDRLPDRLRRAVLAMASNRPQGQPPGRRENRLPPDPRANEGPRGNRPPPRRLMDRIAEIRHNIASAPPNDRGPNAASAGMSAPPGPQGQKEDPAKPAPKPAANETREPSPIYKKYESQFLAAMAIGDTEGAQAVIETALKANISPLDRKRLAEDQDDLEYLRRFELALETALANLQPGEKLRLRSQGGHEFQSYDNKQKVLHTTQFGLKRTTQIGDLTPAEIESLVARELPRDSVETKRILAVFHAFHRLGYPPTAVKLLQEIGLDSETIQRRYSQRD